MASPQQPHDNDDDKLDIPTILARIGAYKPPNYIESDRCTLMHRLSYRENLNAIGEGLKAVRRVPKEEQSCDCFKLDDTGDVALNVNVSRWNTRCKHSFVGNTYAFMLADFHQEYYANGFSYPVTYCDGTRRRDQYDVSYYCFGPFQNDTVGAIPEYESYPFCDHVLDVLFEDPSILPDCLKLSFIMDNMLVISPDTEEGNRGDYVDSDIFSHSRFFERSSYLSEGLINRLYIDELTQRSFKTTIKVTCKLHKPDDGHWRIYSEYSKFIGKCFACESWCKHSVLIYRWRGAFFENFKSHRKHHSDSEDFCRKFPSLVDESLQVKYICHMCYRDVVLKHQVNGIGSVCYGREGCEMLLRCTAFILGATDSGIRAKSSMKIKRLSDDVLSQEEDESPPSKKRCCPVVYVPEQ